MTDTTPRAPLVPADVDLRDFAFMPLDVVRVRDSDLAALEEPAACWAALLLWCASWHQVPAASLPNDDRVLANLAGFGRVVKEWQKLREGALRGWIACSDGRLYHPVVAEKALEAWRGKQAQRWRTECGRIKKHNQRHNLQGADAVLYPEFDAWIAAGCPQGHALPVPGTKAPCPPNVPRETHSKGQGEGQGQGQGQGDPPVPPLPPDPPVSPPTGAPPTARGALSLRFKAVGILPEPGHADFQALADSGAQWEEFEPFVAKSLATDRPFRYVIAAVVGERNRAAKRGPLPPAGQAAESTYAREQRERVEAIAPGLARRAPAANRGATIEAEVTDVTPRTLG